MALIRQKTTRELFEEYTGERIEYVIPLPTDRRRGRNYRVHFRNGKFEIYRAYFNTEADGTHYIEELV